MVNFAFKGLLRCKPIKAIPVKMKKIKSLEEAKKAPHAENIYKNINI